MADCKHAVVTRDKAGATWACDDCGDAFFHNSEVTEAIERLTEESDRVLDTVTGVISATLWDLHQRAGLVGPDDQDGTAMCQAEGHVAAGDSGKCARCGRSLFLGADDAE